MEYIWLSLVIAFIADLLLGDPQFLYHPICFIGSLISFTEKKVRGIVPENDKALLTGGTITVILVLLCCGILPLIILYLAGYIGSAFRFAAGTFMCYQLLAVKSLKVESSKVYKALKNGTLDDGRKAVSMIVGRDTQNLDEKGVVKATVETIAENFSDGVIAPMFYMMLGGPVLMFIYKGINTMDSMLGYKNERYLYFGRCAARLDDIANYIPSRIAGLLLVAASGFAGYNMKNAWHIFRRDRYNHASPNSAQTEAAMAGALEIQLAGNAYYFGKLYKKKTIGDDIRAVRADDIVSANKLLYGGSLLGCILFAAVSAALTLL